MTRLTFKTHIQAPAAKIWSTLWDDATYRQWTSVFSEGSYAVSDWKEGSEIQFLAGDGGGMFSTIDRLIPNKFMSFKHLGEIKDGEVQPIDDKTREWTGAMENYTLEEKNDITELTVDVDITDEFQNYFSETFPAAIKKVKDLSEN